MKPNQSDSCCRIFLIAAPMLTGISTYAGTYAGYGEAPTKNGHLGEKEYGPYLDICDSQHVFWGDTHTHTSFSTDVGNRLGPD